MVGPQSFEGGIREIEIANFKNISHNTNFFLYQWEMWYFLRKLLFYLFIYLFIYFFFDSEKSFLAYFLYTFGKFPNLRQGDP